MKKYNTHGNEYASQLLFDINVRISDLNYATVAYGNLALIPAIFFVDNGLTTYYVRQLIEAWVETDCLKNICISDDLELAKFLMKEGTEFSPLPAIHPSLSYSNFEVVPDESYGVVVGYQPYAYDKIHQQDTKLSEPLVKENAELNDDKLFYEKPYQMADRLDKHHIAPLPQYGQNFAETLVGRDSIVKVFAEDKNYAKLEQPIMNNPFLQNNNIEQPAHEHIISKNPSEFDPNEPSSSYEGFVWEPSSDLESCMRQILSDYDEPPNDEENVELCTSIDFKELIGSDLNSALAQLL